MLLRCYLGPLNIVNFQNFASLGPDISKTGGRTKNFVYTQNLLKVVKNTLEPKKLQIFFYYVTQNFALLPKNDHGPDFVHRIFSITIDSRKCFKKETLWQFTFQQDIG